MTEELLSHTVCIRFPFFPPLLLFEMLQMLRQIRVAFTSVSLQPPQSNINAIPCTPTSVCSVLVYQNCGMVTRGTLGIFIVYVGVLCTSSGSGNFIIL